MDISSMSSSMASIASGSSINSAADNAAGLSISEKMTTEMTATSQNIDNLLSTAEGSLEGVSDSLQRMRELAVQASSDILSDSDKSAIQAEIDELKDGIQDTAKNTQFNTIKLLDGSFSDENTASNSDGTGSSISIASSTLESLGIADFDVTGDFDILDIDDAISLVSESRSSIGSAQNAFEYTTGNLNNKYYNEMNSLSTISDADIEEEITEFKKQEVMQKYQIVMQQKQMDMEEQQSSGLFTSIAV